MKTAFLSDIFVRSKAEAKPGEIIFFLAFFLGGMHPEGLGVSMACCTFLASDFSSDSDKSAEVVLLLFDDVVKGALLQQYITNTISGKFFWQTYP